MHPTRRLLLTHLVFRAATIAPRETVVSRPPDGRFEHSWADVARRARRLAGGLGDLGLAEGDAVATLAFNDHRHLDAFLAVPCLGARLHPVNTRWSDDEIVPVLAHTRDRILMVDGGLADRVGPILERCPWIEHVIGMGPWAGRGPTPIDHEALVEDSTPVESWPDLEETAGMALCSTSGTTELSSVPSGNSCAAEHA